MSWQASVVKIVAALIESQTKRVFFPNGSNLPLPLSLGIVALTKKSFRIYIYIYIYYIFIYLYICHIFIRIYIHYIFLHRRKSLPPDFYPPPPPHQGLIAQSCALNNNFHVVTQRKLVLILCSLYTRVILILIFNEAAFTFEKGANGQNHSMSSSHRPVKKLSPGKTTDPPASVGGSPPPIP